MQICKVVGHIWATKKEPALEGQKFMVVQELDSAGRKKGNVFVAADPVGAGIGEQVLTVTGSTARKMLGGDNIPVDAAIVAIIDTLEVEREKAEGKPE